MRSRFLVRFKSVDLINAFDSYQRLNIFCMVLIFKQTSDKAFQATSLKENVVFPQK